MHPSQSAAVLRVHPGADPAARLRHRPAGELPQAISPTQPLQQTCGRHLGPRPHLRDPIRQELLLSVRTGVGRVRRASVRPTLLAALQGTDGQRIGLHERLQHESSAVRHHRHTVLRGDRHQRRGQHPQVQRPALLTQLHLT